MFRAPRRGDLNILETNGVVFLLTFASIPQRPTARFTMLFELDGENQTAHVTRPSVGTLESSTLGQIATSVASNGETLNILDFAEWLKTQVKFVPDEGCGGVNAVLCMPIVDGSKNIIGVTQLINKVQFSSLIGLWWN